MHSTACGVGAAASAANSTTASMQSFDGLKMVHNNEDAMNKIPLKSASGMDDEEKNGGEFIQDTAAAEEARREQMRVNVLNWMKKLTIVLICFIGIALMSYVLISLCFSDWPKSTHHSSKNTTTNATTATTATDTTITTLASTDPNATTIFTINNNNKQHDVISPSTSDSSSSAPSFPSSNTSLSPDDSNSNSSSTLLSQNSTSSLGESNNNATDSTNNTNNNNIKIAGITDATTTTISPPTSTLSSTGTDGIVNDAGGNQAAITVPTETDEAPLSAASTTAATTKPTTTIPPPTQIFKDVPPAIEEKFTSKLGVYEKAAVCSDKEVCSQIGSNILEQGGSAVDSAIAALLCNGLTTMQSMGIGGGLLMNVYIRESKHAYAIDAREVAPFAAFTEMFDANVNLSINGGLAIAVPGELMGYHQAHERFGKLPWKKLVEPSIQLCHDGFYMSHHMAQSLKLRWEDMKNNTAFRHVFLNASTGQLHPAGSKIHPYKELCTTYELLAENGPLDFYNGTLAELVSQDLNDLGSTITSYDLESYQADVVNSITMQLGDDILYAVPPISSGTVVANVLSILEGFNFTKADLIGSENEALTVHRIAEALKFGFAKRWELGDARFHDVRELVSKLTNPEHSAEIRAQINDSSLLKTTYDYGAQFVGVDDYGTSHLSVLAPNGDAVSVTSSINYYYGASQAGKRTGIIFNSAMNDFSIPKTANMFGLPPAPTNFIEPRKRPMSSMSPMVLTDQKSGDVHMIFGAAGGSKIISALVQVVVRVLWFGQNIKEAIDAPRIHHQLEPNVLEYEPKGFSEEVLKLLQAKGHKIVPFNDIGSVVCAIVRNATAVYANADNRKRGATAGF